MIDETQNQENIVYGIVGAFLFSLSGAAVYFILSLIGFVSFISGFIGVVLACKGYALFAKKESTKGVIVASVFGILSIVIGWYFSMGYEIYYAYATWFEQGEVDFTLTFVESLRAIPMFMEEPDILMGWLGNLGLGLLFAILGAASTIGVRVKNARAAEAAEKEARYRAMNNPSYQSQNYNYNEVESEQPSSANVSQSGENCVSDESKDIATDGQNDDNGSNL